MKRVTILMLFVQLICVAVARAQTAEDLEVAVSVLNVQTNGAEKLAGGSLTTGPVSKKASSAGRFSVRPCGAFSIEARAEGAFADGATTGWRVHITPLGMSDGAVKFRLQWILRPRYRQGDVREERGRRVDIASRRIPIARQRQCPAGQGHRTSVPCLGQSRQADRVEPCRAARFRRIYAARKSRAARPVGVDLWLIEARARER